MPEHTHAVALTCAAEPELRTLLERLEAAGVRHTPIFECDGPHAGQLMAIGCSPAPRKELKRLFSDLPLLK